MELRKSKIFKVTIALAIIPLLLACFALIYAAVSNSKPDTTPKYSIQKFEESSPNMQDGLRKLQELGYLDDNFQPTELTKQNKEKVKSNAWKQTWEIILGLIFTSIVIFTMGCLFAMIHMASNQRKG